MVKLKKVIMNGFLSYKMPLILCFTLLVLFNLTGFSQNTVVPFPDKFVVAQDGSGDFKTIQEAVNAVRDLSQMQVKIFIKSGTYHEKLVIPSWKTKISLIGDDKNTTIITNDDFSGKAYTREKDAYCKDKFSTYNSYTVLISGNDCTLDHLTIKNSSGRVGQAVALHVEGDRVEVNDCNLLGNQDTLYTATENSRQFYSNCFIEGTTDFIFGEATVVFQNCRIKSLHNSYITAAATSAKQKFGFVFFNCDFSADTVANKVYLGRPWRPNAKTVLIRCNLDEHIRAEGWDNWRNAENEKTVFYAEYQNKGKGASYRGRVKWSSQLTTKQASSYTVNNILAGLDGWKPVYSTQMK